MPKYFVVVDLETSGLDAKKHDILEVGLVIANERMFVEHKEQWVVLPPSVKEPNSFVLWSEALQGEQDGLVYNMHRENGLLSALWDTVCSPVARAGGPLPTPAFVEEHIVSVLASFSNDKTDFCLTGNSCSSLDVPMLREHMPKVLQAMSHRVLDVSVLRNFYQKVCGINLPADVSRLVASGGDGKHRALSDAENCYEALKALRTYAQSAHSGATS